MVGSLNIDLGFVDDCRRILSSREFRLSVVSSMLLAWLPTRSSTISPSSELRMIPARATDLVHVLDRRVSDRAVAVLTCSKFETLLSLEFAQ